MNGESKRIFWVGGSLRRLREFPSIAKQIAGRQLRRVQQGEEPADWRSIPSVGSGVREIRIHRPHEHRVIYVAQFPEAIFVLHAFEKKTQRTPKREIDIARDMLMPKLKRDDRNSKNNEGKRSSIEEGSANVFVDLGFSEQEAANLVLRCQLMDVIEKIITGNGWTQREAAKRLSVHQPRVSDLIQGHVDLFSVDMLIEWLDKLGKKISLSVADKEVA